MREHAPIYFSNDPDASRRKEGLSLKQESETQRCRGQQEAMQPSLLSARVYSDRKLESGDRAGSGTQIL